MRTRITATALAAATLLTLTACSPDEEDSPETPAPKTSAPKSAGETTEDAPSAEVETATLPDMTGKVLQTAQDEAQSLGFYNLDSSDATGAERFQAFDRNWKVCSQTPKPGTYPVDTKVNFDTVKTTESC